MAFNFKYNYPQVARESGFKLRNFKDGPLDWRLVGSMEVERILKDQSFEQIDTVLNHLSEIPLGSLLDSNILDSGISKYFMLSQFAVQYLIFCRKFLEETVTDLREAHAVSQMELATMKRNLSESNNESLQLHKKITQMEAIHEIIYPCHLCTKNFVSNDSLNLHISRKHNENLTKCDKRSEISSQPLCRERDLTLINTIKLELEIKQLKERLNNAEREIKEKSFESDIKNVAEVVPTDFQISLEKSVHSIGIQSNLCEMKESDDSSKMVNLTTSPLNRQDLYMLQEKLQEFEKWKDDQKRENSKFLSEINNKLQDIGTALEMVKNQRIQLMDNEAQKSSVEDLEILFNKKVEEIGKTTVANLEHTMKNMEMKYKDKLHQLENELINLNEQNILKKKFKGNESPVRIEDNFLPVSKVQSKTEIDKVTEGNGTDLIRIHEDQQPLKETSASESDRTFVKYSNVACTENDTDNYEKSVPTSGISDEDATGVSVSLLEEESLEKTSKDSVKINTKPRNILQGRSFSLQSRRHGQPKVITKRDARNITNIRLTSLGVDTKTKTLTPLLKKKFLDDLNESRNKIKQKQPQFYVIRNKIKRFVDKLCSTKLPANAKILLEATNHVTTKVQKHLSDDKYSSSANEEYDSFKASTPLNGNQSTNSDIFKQRLERILASPIKKPDHNRITAIVHRENESKCPVPMPRKRVMFNHPEVQDSRSNHSLSSTDSNESQSIERSLCSKL